MNARPPIYLGPTANPNADAERWNDEQEAAEALHEAAARQAPGIVLRQMKAIKTPAGWYDKKRFAIYNSAQDILQGAFNDSNDDVSDRYAEFMIDATPEAREKLLEAMAAWFASVYAVEIYTDHLEDLQ